MARTVRKFVRERPLKNLKKSSYGELMRKTETWFQQQDEKASLSQLK